MLWRVRAEVQRQGSKVMEGVRKLVEAPPAGGLTREWIMEALGLKEGEELGFWYAESWSQGQEMPP